MSSNQDSGTGRPDWLGPLESLPGADPVTGWLDCDRALDALGRLARQVYGQAKVDRGCHTMAGLQSQVQAAQAVLNSVGAVRVAQYPATERAGDAQDVDDVLAGRVAPLGPGAEDAEVLHPLGYKAAFCPDDLGPGLCWGPVSPASGRCPQAGNRVDEAVDAVTLTPRLLDAAGEGVLDLWRLSRVTGELWEAGADTCVCQLDSDQKSGKNPASVAHCKTRTFVARHAGPLRFRLRDRA